MAETGRSWENLEWRGRDCATISKFGDTLCSIKTAEEAEDFWHAYVAWLAEEAFRAGEQMMADGP